MTFGDTKEERSLSVVRKIEELKNCRRTLVTSVMS